MIALTGARIEIGKYIEPFFGGGMIALTGARIEAAALVSAIMIAPVGAGIEIYKNAIVNVKN